MKTDLLLVPFLLVSCQLRGSLPSEIGSIVSLEELYISKLCSSWRANFPEKTRYFLKLIHALLAIHLAQVAIHLQGLYQAKWGNF